MYPYVMSDAKCFFPTHQPRILKANKHTFPPITPPEDLFHLNEMTGT